MKIYIVSVLVEKDNLVGHRATVDLFNSKEEAVGHAMSLFQKDGYLVVSHEVKECDKLMEKLGMAENNGWHSHDGTSDPDVPGHVLVEVCFRDGDKAFGIVYDWDQNWQWADTEEGLKADGAIIAWRRHDAPAPDSHVTGSEDDTHLVDCLYDLAKVSAEPGTARMLRKAGETINKLIAENSK